MGEKQSAINVAQGQKQKVVFEAEAVRQKQINAAADDMKAIAAAVKSDGGMEAMQLRVAEKLSVKL